MLLPMDQQVKSSQAGRFSKKFGSNFEIQLAERLSSNGVQGCVKSVKASHQSSWLLTCGLGRAKPEAWAHGRKRAAGGGQIG